MRKLILASCFAVCGSVQADTFNGRAIIDDSVDYRAKAIISALNSAVDTRNVKVVSESVVDNKVLSSQITSIVSSGVVKSYKVTSEYHCDGFYCVEIDVEFSEQSSVAQPDVIATQGVSLSFYGNGDVRVSDSALFSKFESDFMLYLADSGVNLVQGAPVEMQVNYSISDTSSFFGRMLDRCSNIKVSGVANVIYGSNELVLPFSTALVSQKNVLASIAGAGTDCSSDGKFVLELPLDAVRQLTTAGEAPVGVFNLQGNILTVSNSSLASGDIVKVVVEDLRDSKQRTITALVQSVYRGEAKVMLHELPLDSERVRFLKSITE